MSGALARTPLNVAERYALRRPLSAKLFEQLRATLPGGETRAVTFYKPFPTAIAHGEGATLVDVDGHRYVDVLNNYTALVHGHRLPEIVAAIEQAIRLGTAFPAPTPTLARFASALVERFPAVERVRLTNSGTEAAILALRIARAATGRRRVLVFDGGYHGTAPPFADADPEAVRVPFNDLDALSAALDESIAAVFAEPFLGSGGVIPARPGFIEAALAAAHNAGALFVLDEVQAARNAFGGTHAALNVRPDLVMLGKLIGGGLPIGAVGGRAEHLELTAADGGVIAHSGTFNANNASLAAGLASLEALDQGAIDSLARRAVQLAERIEAAGRAAGVPCSTTRAGSIIQVHMLENAPVDAAEAAHADAPLTAALHLVLMDHGVYAAPRGMLNLSTAVTDEDFEMIAAGYASAFSELAPLSPPPLWTQP